MAKVGKQPVSVTRDGMTGVHPVFVFDTKTPEQMLVVFGGTKLLGNVQPGKASEAIMLHFGTDHIVSVQQAGDA